MKNMKGLTSYLSLFFLVFPIMAPAQVSLGISGGLSTYQMNDLKKINTKQASSLPFETVLVDNFDQGWYLHTSVTTKISEKFLIGMVYRYYATGSRIGQRDYTGYYTFDQIVSAHFLGIEPEVMIARHKYIEISLSLVTGLNFTDWEFKQVLFVQGQEDKESQSLVALSLPFNPSLNLYVPVLSKLNAKISAGYLVDTGAKLHLKGNKDSALMLNNEPVKTGWSGFRITVGFCYNIH